MLWYKAWLETRRRLLFVIGSMAVILLTLPARVPSSQRLWLAVNLGSSLLYLFAALFLAGAGINSQTTYGYMSGFHGSMLFTFSLPVSRRRLFFVRAGLGAIETCVFVALTILITLHWRPEAASPVQLLLYATRALACTLAVYALSALLACVFDETWQFMGGCLCLSAVWLLQSHFELVSRLSPLRGMLSLPASAPMPWAPVLASVVLIGILGCASVLVLQRKEY